MLHTYKNGAGRGPRATARCHVAIVGLSRHANGTGIAVQGLAEPVSVRIPNTTSSTGGACSWWKQQDATWSTSGCNRTAVAPDDGLGEECLCTHLTEFALVGDEAAQLTPTPTAEADESSLSGGSSSAWPSVAPPSRMSGFPRRGTGARGPTSRWRTAPWRAWSAAAPCRRLPSHGQLKQHRERRHRVARENPASTRFRLPVGEPAVAQGKRYADEEHHAMSACIATLCTFIVSASNMMTTAPARHVVDDVQLRGQA